VISYEFPLNERVRTLLRLEDLYDKAEYFAGSDDPRPHHTAIIALFEILDVASRADLKSELMQELERQRQNLEALRSNPAISTDALDKVLKDIDRANASLYQASGKTGQEIRENDWLMSIRQRAAIPGGVCEFDLPSYHFWLHQDPALRRAELHKWLGHFSPLREGVRIVLRLLRESGKSASSHAPGGVFQQMMGGRLAQMLRVSVAAGLPCVPEVSANKYALNVRFTHALGPERGKTFDQDVSFELVFCNI
jgi:cell division protein ZapD